MENLNYLVKQNSTCNYFHGLQQSLILAYNNHNKHSARILSQSYTLLRLPPQSRAQGKRVWAAGHGEVQPQRAGAGDTGNEVSKDGEPERGGSARLVASKCD